MEDAAARRERLKALKAAAQLAAADGGGGDGGGGGGDGDASMRDAAAAAGAGEAAGPSGAEEDGDKPTLKFRNYVVKDARIEHEQLAPAPLAKPEEPAAEARPEEAAEEDLLMSVAPKKANWDLKRDLQPKLDKLERRTLRALVEIMRDEERRRLEEEGGVAD